MVGLTQTRCEQLGVEVRDELLRVCVKLAHPGDDVAWKTDAYYFHNGLEDEQGKVREIRVRAVRRGRVLLESFQEAIAGIRLRGHNGEVGRGRRAEVAQAQRLDGTIEKRHCWRVCSSGTCGGCGGI